MFHARLKLPAACEAGRVSRNALFRFVSILAVIGGVQIASGQVDSARKDPQLAYNQQLSRQAPQVFSAGPQLEDGPFLLTNTVLFQDSAELRLEGGSRSGQLFPSAIERTNGLFQGESLYNPSSFQGQRAESLLLADVERFDQSQGWRIGEGGVLSYRFRKLASRIFIHCGPSFKPAREAFEGERCFGLLFRFDLGKSKPVR